MAVRRDWAYERLNARAHWKSSFDRLGTQTCCGSVDGSDHRLAGSRLVENNCNVKKKFRDGILNKHLLGKRRQLTTESLFLADPPIGRINIICCLSVFRYIGTLRSTVSFSIITIRFTEALNSV